MAFPPTSDPSQPLTLHYRAYCSGAKVLGSDVDGFGLTERQGSSPFQRGEVLFEGKKVKWWRLPSNLLPTSAPPRDRARAALRYVWPYCSGPGAGRSGDDGVSPADREPNSPRFFLLLFDGTGGERTIQHLKSKWHQKQEGNRTIICKSSFFLLLCSLNDHVWGCVLRNKKPNVDLSNGIRERQ